MQKTAVRRLERRLANHASWPRLYSVAVLCMIALQQPAIAACRYVKIASLPVDTEERSPRVDGSVNGLPIKILIDTGSDGTALTRAAAEQAKLPLSHSEGGSYGVGGDSEEYMASVQEFKLGPARWGGIRMRVIWDVGLHHAGAIVGANYLLQNDVELALQEGAIRLFKPEDCKDTYLGYWDKDAIVLPMLNKPVTDLTPGIMVEVNGQPMRALLDTGAQFSSIDQKAAARVGVTKPADGSAKEGEISGIGSRKVASWTGSFATVAIGPEEIRHAKLTVMDMWGGARRDLGFRGGDMLREAPEVVLGADFLAAHRVLLAMSQRRVYLTHLGGPVFASGSGRAAPSPARPAAPEPAASAP